MFSGFLGLSSLFSSVSAFVPIVIMLRYRKVLIQRSFGISIFGYIASLFLAGVIEYLFAFLCRSGFPAHHIFIVPLAFFTFLLFKNEYYNVKYKQLAYLFLGLSLLSEVVEFIVRGGFLTNNTITYSIVNLTFIAHYLLYIIDNFKNKPSLILNPKGSFMIISATFIYSINQLLFSFVIEGIRFQITNNYANLMWGSFTWLYILYLYFICYLLWKNLRGQ